MGSIVLVEAPWPLDDAATSVGDVVGRRLGARVLRLGARPNLQMYDLVVVVAPTWSLVDPFFLTFAVDRELSSKTLALVTDAPPAVGPGLFGPWCAAAERLGGARWWPDTLHLGPWVAPGWPPRATRGTLAAVEAWAERLSEAHPAPVYPRGPGGRRRTDG